MEERISVLWRRKFPSQAPEYGASTSQYVDCMPPPKISFFFFFPRQLKVPPVLSAVRSMLAVVLLSSRLHDGALN